MNKNQHTPGISDELRGFIRGVGVCARQRLEEREKEERVEKHGTQHQIIRYPIVKVNGKQMISLGTEAREPMPLSLSGLRIGTTFRIPNDKGLPEYFAVDADGVLVDHKGDFYRHGAEIALASHYAHGPTDEAKVANVQTTAKGGENVTH